MSGRILRNLAHASRWSAAVALAACAALDPNGSDGTGTARFTTWGEAYVEEGIASDPTGASGFVDGWSVKYEKFLVVFHGITVADQSGEVAARLSGSRLVDNTKPGKKELVSFTGLEARAWDRVSYQVKPADADTLVVTGDESDKALMVANGYSIYVAGTATKTDAAGATVKKTFAWGFKAATQYSGCHAESGGKDTLGIVVKTGGTDTSELTTHGDHFFYDRLSASPDPTIATSLRFEEKARADAPPYGDGDGDITLEELRKVPIDVRTYDPSGIDAPTLGTFMEALARTVGHFRGEGECTISKL